MSSAPLVVEYWFWEMAVSAICLAALVKVPPTALKLALLIGLNVTLSALCATLFSFLHLNTPAAYLTVASLFVAVAMIRAWNRRGQLFDSLRVERAPEAMLLWFALGLFLALAIRPIEEVDSLYNLHYIMGWVQNRTTPYVSAYHYVPFWELTFVPGLVLTHSDLFFWYNSLKPVLLLGLVLFLIARELDLPDRLAIWTLPSLLLFPHLWLGPSGVATIKNDMLSAAGYAIVALVAVRTARAKSTAIDILLALLAVTFVSVKFSGPIVLAAWTGILILASASWIRNNLKTAALASSAIGFFWLVAVGHYYFHNFAVFGNPLYPHQLNLGPLHLPGTADLSYSSILYNLHDARLWRYFFLPERGISPAGVFFPLVLPLILIGSVISLVIALRRWQIEPLTALGLFQLVSWAVYFRSTFSASGSPGDLAFVANDLNSLRYVEGPLLIGELCLVWALYRIRTPRILIFLALAVQFSSRVLLVSRRAPETPWLLAALFGLLLALFALAIRPKVIAIAAPILVAICLGFGSYLVERRRPVWLTNIQPLYRPLYEAPPQDLFYLIDNEFSQQPCWHFALLGHRLQHEADSGSLSRLMARRPMPRYVAWTRATPDQSAITLPGYRTVVSSPAGILLVASQTD